MKFRRGGVEAGGADLRAQGDRHRGLREHGGDDGGLGHHGEREAAGETHADRADFRARRIGVRLSASARSQPTIGLDRRRARR